MWRMKQLGSKKRVRHQISPMLLCMKTKGETRNGVPLKSAWLQAPRLCGQTVCSYLLILEMYWRHKSNTRKTREATSLHMSSCSFVKINKFQCFIFTSVAFLLPSDFEPSYRTRTPRTREASYSHAWNETGLLVDMIIHQFCTGTL